MCTTISRQENSRQYDSSKYHNFLRTIIKATEVSKTAGDYFNNFTITIGQAAFNIMEKNQQIERNKQIRKEKSARWERNSARTLRF